MQTKVALSAILFAMALAACPSSNPEPNTPRREATPPPRAEPDPRPAARTEPAPEPRRAPPPCTLQSPSKAYCLRVQTTERPGCGTRFCKTTVFQIYKAGGELVFELPAFRVGKPIHLTDKGELVSSPHHAIVAPTSLVALVYRAGNPQPDSVQASDLLAPSRFAGTKPLETKLQGKELQVLHEGNAIAILDLETLAPKAADVHCQVLAKGRVVVGRSAVKAAGTLEIGRGTCEKPLVEWSFAASEAPVAITRDGRRVITRTPHSHTSRTAPIITVWQRKAKTGAVLRELGLRDLTKLTERLPPETCGGFTCRALPSYEFAAGGKLTIRFPWGKEKTVDVTSPAILRVAAPTYAAGPARAPKTGAWQPFMGDPKAKATITVYGDLQCPFTAMVMLTLVDLLSVQPKGLKVLWQDFPLAFHKNAMPAAIAARSVLAQKGPRAFFAFVLQTLANQTRISPDTLAAWAKAAGANPDKVKADLAAEKGKADIQASLDQGKQAGVMGTPTLFLNGQKAGHANGFWHIRKQLEPVLGKALRKVK